MLIIVCFHRADHGRLVQRRLREGTLVMVHLGPGLEHGQELVCVAVVHSQLQLLHVGVVRASN